MAIYNLSNNKTTKSNNNKDYEKIIGITLIVISSICFVALLTNLLLFLKYFLLGVFGLFSYPLFITTFVIGMALVNHKKYVMSKKYIIFLIGALFSLLCIFHLVFIDKSGSFFEYLGRCYSAQITVGGIVCGLLTAPILFILNQVGAYIVFSALFIIFAALFADYIYYLNKNATIKRPVQILDIDSPINLQQPKMILPERQKNEKDFVLEKEQKNNIVLDAKIDAETYEDDAKRKLGLIKSSNSSIY